MSVPEVPVMCPGGTVAILGGGPSLTQADVDYCRSRADAVIAINTSYLLAKWAPCLYAADHKWWDWHRGAPDFPGLKYALQKEASKWPGVQILQNTGKTGLEVQPTGLRTGNNGGYQAINLAVHFGAKRIILLGYDMQSTGGKRHWFGDHPKKSDGNYETFLQAFPALIEPLKQIGVSVINCTRVTKLQCFPCQPLEEALP